MAAHITLESLNGMTEDKKIFIGGLSFEATETDLRIHFSQYGELSHVHLPRHKFIPNKSRGFAFISFKDPRITDWVVEQDHIICNRRADVKVSVPRNKLIEEPKSVTDCSSGTVSAASSVSDASEYSSCKLFVGGLANTVNDTALKTYFSEFGPVRNCTVMIDRETTRSRGFGFVVFQDEQSTCRVLLQSIHYIHEKLIEVKPAVPKDLLQSAAPSNPAPAWSQQIVYYPEQYPPVYHMVIGYHPQHFHQPYPQNDHVFY